MRVSAWGLLMLSGLMSGCGLPSQARADAATVQAYLFTLVGSQTMITFSLPPSPIPDGYANECAFNENTFCKMHVPITVNGETKDFMTTFYGNGGMSLAAGATVPMLDLVGPHLFTGTLQNPTFTTGQYTLVTGNPRLARTTYTLTVASVPAR